MNRHSHPELGARSVAPTASASAIRSGRGVTAVLGPTNTGKTHLAIERMLAQPSGMIGLPLRLLAREVYNRVVERAGADAVALITGEEKIIPPTARFSVCTVEAMPSDADVHFLAIDEIQLAADLYRGHIFTDRLLNLRGSHETMLLGAATLRPALEALLPGINIITRPRMSQLLYAGQKKITRLPRRSAIVAFSADEVYAIAELIRRQRGAAAVVLGSLSPRTRNAQVALYQSGDVDFLVATDAIGMGLNLDLDHVAFAQDQKFDGHQQRRLKPAELAQIAGRAGRHTRDGTFGVTSRVDPFEDELVERLEAHEFPPEKLLQWRNRKLDFSSIADLVTSLEQAPDNPVLVKAPLATDQRAFTTMASLVDIKDRVGSADRVEALWQVAQVPDYRKIAPANHADLLATMFRDICDDGHIDEDWFANQVKQTDNAEGDIDALSNRIAHIRTWTYVSNRKSWLQDAAHWQAETRAIENRLSDALHERLTKRFVDRRTSVLMKRLRENTMLEAEIAPSGAVMVEGHHVGELSGFRFTADAAADGPDAKAARAAAQKALASEIEARARRIGAAPNADIVLDSDGTLRWIGAPVGRLTNGETALKPRVILLADELLNGTARDGVVQRLERWIAHHIDTLLKPIVDLADAEDLSGLGRGIAFRLVEQLGTVDRREIANDLRQLDQDQRAQLRRKGVRFGAHHVFIPALLKPAPANLICLLWALAHDGMEAAGREDILAALSAGRTSMPVDPSFDTVLYRLAGFRPLGNKAVRVDMLERLADFIRPASGWRFDGQKPSKRPDGAWDGGGFMITPAMLSILGASAEDMAAVLQGLGYRNEALPEETVVRKLDQWDMAFARPKEETKEQAEETKAPGDSPEPSESDGAPTPAVQSETSVEPAETEAVSESAAPESDEPAKPVEYVVRLEVAASDGKAPSEGKAETAEEATPVRKVDIWRYGRAGGSRRGSQDQARQSNRGGKPDGKSRGKAQGKPGGQFAKRGNQKAGAGAGRGSKGGRHVPADKPLDPDSPFAKLAALKADLEKK